MRYFLSKDVSLRRLESPHIYHIRNDELYELDNDSFDFLKRCSSDNGWESEDNEFVRYCLDEELLTSENISVKRPALKQSPIPSLRYLELQITDKCNLSCKHCYIYEESHRLNPPSPPFNKGGMGGFNELHAQNSRELSLPQVKQILSEFEEMQGLRVLITGGEPLIHAEFNKINEILPQFALRKVLFTNGLLLKKDILNKLNVHEIQVSIDGLEHGHDSIRGAGTFRASMNAIKDALDAGFDVSVSTMVHPGNLNDFDSLEKMFKDMNIKDWTVDVPCFTGRLAQNMDLQVSPEIGGKYLKYGFGDGLHTTDTGYGCGLHLMSVLSNGKIAKCTFYEDKAVGAIDEGLRACWQRIKPIELKSLECVDCQYLELCRGGCRYRAELCGNPLGKDPFRCVLYGIP